jgi:hypothetical protein
VIASLLDQVDALERLAALEHRHPGLPPARISIAPSGAIDVTVEPREVIAWTAVLHARRFGDALQGWLGAHEVTVHEPVPEPDPVVWAVPA